MINLKTVKALGIEDHSAYAGTLVGLDGGQALRLLIC